MKLQRHKIYLALLMSAAAFASCNKNKTAIEPNEEEVITTMKLNFEPAGGGPTLTYQFDDTDGPGGNSPTQDEIVLAPATSYNVTVQLLNKTETPSADITAQVLEESDAHRFYYEPAPVANIAVTSLDNDINSIPLGITSVWATGANATGKINITLRHYIGTPPDKAVGDPVNSPKSSADISVVFDTRVQ